MVSLIAYAAVSAHAFHIIRIGRPVSHLHDQGDGREGQRALSRRQPAGLCMRLGRRMRTAHVHRCLVTCITFLRFENVGYRV